MYIEHLGIDHDGKVTQIQIIDLPENLATLTINLHELSIPKEFPDLTDEYLKFLASWVNYFDDGSWDDDNPFHKRFMVDSNWIIRLLGTRATEAAIWK